MDLPRRARALAPSLSSAKVSVFLAQPGSLYVFAEEDNDLLGAWSDAQREDSSVQVLACSDDRPFDSGGRNRRGDLNLRKMLLNPGEFRSIEHLNDLASRPGLTPEHFAFAWFEFHDPGTLVARATLELTSAKSSFRDVAIAVAEELRAASSETVPILTHNEGTLQGWVGFGGAGALITDGRVTEIADAGYATKKGLFGKTKLVGDRQLRATKWVDGAARSRATSFGVKSGPGATTPKFTIAALRRILSEHQLESKSE